MHTPLYRRQHGATLIVALVMLTLMTLITLGAINISTGNFKIITNVQFQQEATAAAQSAINQVLSKGTYLSEPDTAPTTLTVSVNNEDYIVELSKPCLRSSMDIQNMELSDPDIWKCTDSAAYKPGVPAGTLCAQVIWQVTANVAPIAGSNTAANITKARVQLVEGAAIRMDKIEANLIKQTAANVCS